MTPSALSLALLLLLGATPAPEERTAAVVATETASVDDALVARLLETTHLALAETALVAPQTPAQSDATLRKAKKSARTCGAEPGCIAKLGKVLGVRYVVAIGAANLGLATGMTLSIIDAQSGMVVGRSDRVEAGDLSTMAVAGALTAALPVQLCTPSATLVVLSDVERAAVLVDDMPFGTTPLSPLTLSMGEHIVRVEREGHQPFRKKIKAEPGMVIESRATRVPLDVGTLAPLNGPPPEQPTSGRRGASYVAAGVAVAALGSGVGFGLWTSSEKDRYLSSCRSHFGRDCATVGLPGEEPQSLADIRDSAQSKSLVANVSYGLAGTAAAAAVVLFLLDGTESPAAGTSLYVAPAPDGAAVSLCGSF